MQPAGLIHRAPPGGWRTGLANLGTMIAYYRADWGGNTINGSKLETFQNIFSPGTHDLPYSGTAGDYEATGWKSSKPTCRVQNGWKYNVNTFASDLNGTTSITFLLAVRWINVQTDKQIWLQGASAHQFQLRTQSGTKEWELRRKGPGGDKYATSAVVPSGYELVIGTFDGSTEKGTVWRNDSKIVNAVDLAVGSVDFNAFWVGPSVASIDYHIALIGVYSTAFNDDQAAGAGQIVGVDYSYP